jgi:hypothetical protein
VALADGQGGAWGSALDPAPAVVEALIRRCFDRTLRDRPATRGWLEGPMQANGGNGHFTLALHVARSEGLPADLVQCIEASGRGVVVDMDQGAPTELSFYASLE